MIDQKLIGARWTSPDHRRPATRFGARITGSKSAMLIPVALGIAKQYLDAIRAAGGAESAADRLVVVRYAD